MIGRNNFKKEHFFISRYIFTITTFQFEFNVSSSALEYKTDANQIFNCSYIAVYTKHCIMIASVVNTAAPNNKIKGYWASYYNI